MKRNNQSPELSIVIPIFNEEKIIPQLYTRLKKAATDISAEHELIFVNDGSKDGSLQQLMNLAAIDSKVFFINFSRNFGHQIAVTAGLDACNGKAVAIIDGDLQDPPELIPEMYDKYKSGYEVVYGKRLSREGETFFKKFSAKLFYRVLRKSTSIDIPLDTGDFRLIDKKVVDYLKKMPEQNKFLRGQIAWLGFRQTEVLFNRDKRRFGTTGYPLSKMLKFAMDGITSFSNKPLSLVTKLGFVFSFFSFALILYALFSYFVMDKTITGWTSLIISTSFIGGIQLISIGIIGEYLARINRNVLNRPLYIVASTNLAEENDTENHDV